MKPEIVALFSTEVQTEAARRFGVDANKLKPLDGFENFASECYRDNKPYILRIAHDSHRREDQVKAELHWIAFLAERGVSVCRPLLSKDGSLTETVHNSGSDFIAVVFEKASGRFVPGKDMTPAMIRNRGKQLGQIHALSKEYELSVGGARRMQWYEEHDFVKFDEYLPASDKKVRRRFGELIDKLRSIPTDDDNYGLIHFDAHHGNLLFDADHPTLFDFDDCAYDFFISDLAIPLFYMITFPPSGWDKAEFARHFFEHFLIGYREAHSLNDNLLELVPLILKRREIVLYVAIHRGMDMNNLDEWCTRYMNGRRELIENNFPYLDVDFNAFSSAALP